MAFWGCVLKPGQKTPVSLQGSDVLHLSQACLHDPKDGPNYLQVDVDGAAYSIACLQKGKREHDCLDLFFDSKKTSFVAKGNSEIHLMGYIEPSGEDSESESPEVVTKAVSSKTAPKVVAASSPKVSASPAKSSPKAAPQAVGEDSDDDLSEGEEEEEEQSFVHDAASSMEDEEEESESPGQKQKLEKLKASKAQSPKRQAASEPQASPAKKAKGDNADEAEYVKKLIDHLKANGKTNLGQLGSKVARPAGVPKIKVVLEAHKDKFVLVGDVVTAK